MRIHKFSGNARGVFTVDSQLLEAECVRRGLPTTRIGSAVFVCEGVAFFGSAAPSLGSLIVASEKPATKMLLAQGGVKVPKGDVFTKPPVSAAFPVCVKPSSSTGAKGVSKVTGPAGMGAAFRAAQRVSREVIVEEWVDGPKYRLLVVGGRVVAVFRSEPKPGGIASAHAGAKRVEAYGETGAEDRVAAVRAAELVGLAVCGVDLIVSADGPVVLEVNSVPRIWGHHHPDRGNPVDAAAAIVDWFLTPSDRRV